MAIEDLHPFDNASHKADLNISNAGSALAYARLLLESKKVLTDPNKLISKLLEEQLEIRTDIEKLLVNIDLLRRTAYRILGGESRSLIYNLLKVIIHYKNQSSLSTFQKVTSRLLENCIALIKESLSGGNCSDIDSMIGDLNETARLLNQPKYMNYVANINYNHGINLYRNSLKKEAICAWTESVDIQRHFVDVTTTLSFAKKIERLVLAHTETGNLNTAWTLAIEALDLYIKHYSDRLISLARSDSLSLIIRQFDDLDRFLLVMVNVSLRMFDASCATEWNYTFMNIEPEIEGLILEWILKILVSLRRSVTSLNVGLLIGKLVTIYAPICSVRHARTILFALSQVSDFSTIPSTLNCILDSLAHLEKDVSSEVLFPLSRFKSDLTASLYLYLSVIRFQSSELNLDEVNQSINLWREIIYGKENPEYYILDSSSFLSNLQLLSDMLEILGNVQSHVNVLLCMKKFSESLHPKLHIRSIILLAQSYLRLGYTGRALSYIMSCQSAIANIDNLTIETIVLYIAEVDYLRSTGQIEKAKSKAISLCDNYRKLMERSLDIQHDINIRALLFISLSSIFLENGQITDAIAFSKTAVKLYNKAIYQKNRKYSKKHDGKIDYFSPSIWPELLGLLRSYCHLGSLYDHQGMVRETDFYLSEALKISQMVYSPALSSYFKTIYADFCIRSGNLSKGHVYLTEAEKNKCQENALHNILQLLAFSRYHHIKLQQDDENAIYESLDSYISFLIQDSIGCDKDISSLDDMFSQLHLATGSSRKTRSSKITGKALCDVFGLSRLKAHVCRCRAGFYLEYKDWKQVERHLQNAAFCSNNARDYVLQNLFESKFNYNYATALLENDPVFGVLPDSAISIPSISSLRSSVKPSRDSPSNQANAGQHRTRKSRSTKRDLAEIQKILNKSRSLIMDNYFRALKICSVHEQHLFSNKLAQILLLQSAIGNECENAYSPAANYFFEHSKGLSLNRDTPAYEDVTLQANISFKEQSTNYNVLDLNEFQDSFINIIPEKWAAVSLSICEETGDLIVSRFQANESPFLLRLPLNRHCSRDADEDMLTVEEALTELQDIISKSNETSQASKKLQNSTKAEKQQWWTERRALDERLKELLANIEYCWLGGFRGILSGNIRHRELLGKFSTSFMQMLKKHLPSRRLILTRQRAKQKPQEVNIDPRVLELFIGLGDPSNADNSEMLEDLIYFVLDILQFHGECNAYDELDMDQIVVDIQEIIRMYYESLDDIDEKLEHIVLILDKTSHMFPWESLTFMRNQSTSRLPSLRTLRDILVNNADRKLDPSNGAFILNPSKDLLNTQNQFERKLEGLGDWVSVISRAPNENEMISFLQERDIVLYFGHGGGEQYVRPSQIKNLDKCAATFLLGCSSGALHSSGEFEPWGTPMNYLIGKCPTLLANLWDVTDRDIDRFTDNLFMRWGLYEDCQETATNSIRKAATGIKIKEQCSLGLSIAKARESCTLKYLNGAAPVLYGIPLELLQQ
ncbi:peptidase family C50-domain-containing protein [Dipodascopsis uninucleata]